MPISYLLTTPVVDLPYDLPSVYADPPATVGELFRQLSYGELSDLKAGTDGSGVITPARRNQVVFQANEALRNLHQKFQLIRQVKELVVPASLEPFESLVPVAALGVISLLVPGRSLTFLTHPVPGKLYLFNRKLVFPPSHCEYKVQATYQNRHPILRPISAESDLEQPIYLKAELWPALRAYIAGEIYGNMNTVDAKNSSREYRARYLQICAEVEAEGGIPQGMLDDQKFAMRGFV